MTEVDIGRPGEGSEMTFVPLASLKNAWEKAARGHVGVVGVVLNTA